MVINNIIDEENEKSIHTEIKCLKRKNEKKKITKLNCDITNSNNKEFFYNNENKKFQKNNHLLLYKEHVINHQNNVKYINMENNVSNNDLYIPDQDNWVQCDLCEKWRRLPQNINMENLPKVWYCKLNNDVRYNSCDIQEEVVVPYNYDVNKITDKNTISFNNNNNNNNNDFIKNDCSYNIINAHNITNRNNSNNNNNIVALNTNTLLYKDTNLSQQNVKDSIYFINNENKNIICNTQHNPISNNNLDFPLRNESISSFCHIKELLTHNKDNKQNNNENILTNEIKKEENKEKKKLSKKNKQMLHNEEGEQIIHNDGLHSLSREKKKNKDTYENMKYKNIKKESINNHIIYDLKQTPNTHQNNNSNNSNNGNNSNNNNNNGYNNSQGLYKNDSLGKKTKNDKNSNQDNAPEIDDNECENLPEQPNSHFHNINLQKRNCKTKKRKTNNCLFKKYNSDGDLYEKSQKSLKQFNKTIMSDTDMNSKDNVKKFKNFFNKKNMNKSGPFYSYMHFIVNSNLKQKKKKRGVSFAQ